MANTYHNIYVQIIFAVKFRHAVLHQEWRRSVFGVIGNLMNESKCKTMIVNGVDDHVHCFAGIHPAVSVSDLMQSVKAKSSKFINDNNLTDGRFEWQKGFAAFSYSKSQVDKVFNYIVNQEQHHKQQNFLDEYTDFLKAYEIEYDPKYIFVDLI